MDPKIAGEVFQGVSVLSDAQELLDRDPEAANDHINHAKRHLIRAMDWIEPDRAAMFQAMDLLCTLGEGTHAALQGPLVVLHFKDGYPEDAWITNKMELAEQWKAELCQRYGIELDDDGAPVDKGGEHEVLVVNSYRHDLS